MEEDLSALIDGELDGSAASRYLQRLCSKADLQEAWRLYWLIGAHLRGEFPGGASSTVSSRIAERRSRKSLQRASGAIPVPGRRRVAH
jgi:sigma-E factor negative regulatory protein RseA